MSEKKDYTIHLKAFDGPMELLLHLIEKNKIDIYDIPMAELTHQYLDYLAAMREMDMDVTSSFLLPKREKTEDGEEEDPRRELVERLLEYKRFKKISEVLGSMADLQEHFVGRAPLDLPVRHLPPGNIDLKLLVDAFREVMRSKEETASVPSVIVKPEPYPIEDKMAEILQKLRAGTGSLPFAAVFAKGNRRELIITFLALLELMKKQEVLVRQPHLFGSIVIMLRNKA